MDRTFLRRGVPGVAAVAALFLGTAVLPAQAAPGNAYLPHGLVKTEEHTQVREITPAVAALSAPAAFKSLNYVQQVQQQNQWCWAATGASIEKTLGVTVSQQQFCSAGKGGSGASCPNQAAQIPEIVRGFRGTGFSSQDARGPISFASITQQIDAGIPHLTGIYWTAGGGHAEVIYGYDSTNQSIQVGDPWPTYQRYQTWNYTQYRSNSRFRWNDTIVNIRKG